MFASEKDLSSLMELQEADMEVLNLQKKLQQLPQRAQMQELAQKKQGVLAKLAQVSKMHEAARRKVTQIEDETAILERKRDETQEKIDAAKGDFRAVQSLTRDLDGIAKRLGTLEGELLEHSEKYEQVDAVKKQIDGAVSALDAQALKIRDSFQSEASELKAAESEARARRDALAAHIDAALLKAYESAAKRGGGMGVARLVDNHCSTCRNHIDDNRMLQIKREAPLSACPSCGRLLIVE